jgi:D-threo-aldose 1-dehydrogenase
MTFNPRERLRLGQTNVAVTRLGLGAASIGGLYRAVSDQEAVRVVDHAWDIGIRYFDTAPLYGYGNGERRMGLSLSGKRRAEFVLSTKVGRLLVERDAIPPGADVDRQLLGNREDAYYVGTPPVRPVFDYSRDGVRRSLEQSLVRLGLDRVDIVYVHDPDDHWVDALTHAYPALEQLRGEGVIGAIGAGMNQSAMLVRFARETNMDVFMLAGRYTLLDQEALDELLPVCIDRHIAVVAVGVMNSGILAKPEGGATYNYRPADAAMLRRASELKAACERHGVPLRAAAIQFVLANPAITSLVAGVRTMAHLDDYPEAMKRRIPAGLWAELRERGLIRADAPVPQEN